MTDKTLSLRFGFTSLFAWAAFGLALEVTHGFKLALLDDAFAFSLLRLAHAHGVGLGMVVALHGLAQDAIPTTERAGHALRIGAILVPLGFALGAIAHAEGDPGAGVLLVPIGAVLVLFGLFALARAAFR